MKNSRPFSLAGWVGAGHMLVAVLGVACVDSPKGEPAPTPAAAEPGDVAGPRDAGSPAVESAPAGSPETGSFGVPECDAYVKKYLACVGAMASGERREGLIRAFEANRAKWRALSTMREGAVALGLACRAAAQKSKEELTVEYGCEF
jgi:hypothetical protein